MTDPVPSLRSGFMPEKTVLYKTYIKEALVDAVDNVFRHHPDEDLQRTKTSIDYPKTEADYPAVVIRFYERDIKNAGVGHVEHIDLTDMGIPGIYRFKHYFYHGDIEFAIYGMTSKDRDLTADTIVQMIAMGNLEAYTNRFFTRVYPDEERVPDSLWHFININSDEINGFGEAQDPTPWRSEDDLIYKVSYRVATFGEFYSVPPDVPADKVSAVNIYPYIEGLEDVPEGDPDDGGEWIP